ncbi:hypothetical protein MRB53_024249 [Persea americana]|uniref:Uncharacterized protein n=1 Tax=Persea americana TaxID=3435 RepID=A0ACC2LBP2_PERAE|nr:hypothetical protein MRB53_024249 [Persea americana]
MGKTQTGETNDSGSLFRAISEIVGTENLRTSNESPEIPIFEETHIRDSEISTQHVSGSSTVCENSKESIRVENVLGSDKSSKVAIFEDTHFRDSKMTSGNDSCSPAVYGDCEESIPLVGGIDIGINHLSEEIVCGRLILEKPDLGDVLGEENSPMVHKITEIIRAENLEISMEERLENSGFRFDSDIVEKVLKRCFKVGHLAHRFFNWVKVRPGFRHTTETYNTMIYIAGEAKEFNLVEKLIDEMDNELCLKNINTWTILISHYGKAKMTGKALLAFEKMRKSGCQPDKAAYKSMIRVLCNAGKAELAMEFYKEMVSKNMEVEIKLYTILMNCLSRLGDVVTVRLIADDMIKISQIPEHEVYSCMLKSLCMSGRTEEALALFHEFKTKTLTCSHKDFEVLVTGLCRAGRVNDALDIVNIMKKNYEVDEKIYGIIVNGYLRSGDVSKATEVFDSMQNKGYLPMVSTCTDIIQHLCRSNEYEKACKIYEEMLANGLELDIVAFTAMVAGHVRHNRISEAWKAFEAMKRKGLQPTWKAYSVFIKELCEVSKPDEAFKLLNEMWDSKINAGDGVFNMIISSLGKQGKWEKVGKVRQMSRAFKLQNQEAELEDLQVDCQSLQVKNHTVDAPNNTSYSSTEDLGLIEPLRKAYVDCDLQELCEILSSSKDWLEMQEALEKNAIHYTPELVLETLHSCQRHGYAALRFFSWVGQQAAYTHTADTYNMAIKISGSAKDFKHMRKLYLEMRRKDCMVTANTWTIMIAQYGRAGLTEIALKKFEEMKIDGCEPNESTYKHLIIHLCGQKGRKVDKAIEIFHDMVNAGYMPDRELGDIYLACLCEEGKLSAARKCVEFLCRGGFAIQVGYSLLVKALCRAGNLDEALALEDELGMLGCTADQYIYGSLVHGLLRQGRLNEAIVKVNAMKEKGLLPTVHVYTSLIVHFFKAKQIQKALEIFKKMRADGCEPTVVTYSALIRGYMNEGMFSDAWNVFRRMKLKGPFPDFRTYSMFLTCLCGVGRSEDALQLIYEMSEAGILPSSINFRTVFYGLNREGKQDLAQTVLQTKWALARKRKFLA